jgi:hypothetical protein
MKVAASSRSNVIWSGRFAHFAAVSAFLVNGLDDLLDGRQVLDLDNLEELGVSQGKMRAQVFGDYLAHHQDEDAAADMNCPRSSRLLALTPSQYCQTLEAASISPPKQS